jgi:uncharacterized LabA/DUF88 family protein
MEGRTTERVAVFVDGANLYHSIKNYYKGVLDYARLLSAAVGDRKLLRATFYIVEKQETDETQGTPSARSFVYNLNKFGYKVRSKPLVVHETLTPSGEKTISHKGDWDIGVVVDMMRLAAHADTYVLVSGDGDYIEAVEYLQSEKGPRRLRRPHRPGGHPRPIPASQPAKSSRRSSAGGRPEPVEAEPTSLRLLSSRPFATCPECRSPCIRTGLPPSPCRSHPWCVLLWACRHFLLASTLTAPCRPRTALRNR